MSIKKIFSSKPAQITHAAIKLSSQIFGDDKDLKVGAIGDKDLVFSIAENFKNFGYEECRIFKKSNSLYINSERKKIIDKNSVLKDFFIFDVVLIGFNDGLKVISKDMTQIFLKKRKQKPIFFVDVGLPGNVDPEISKISNCYLFDLNDLEQFFTLFFENNDKKFFFNDNKFSFGEEEVISYFFKKLNLNKNQKEIFNYYFEDFFIKNSEKDFREMFIKFFKSFK